MRAWVRTGTGRPEALAAVGLLVLAGSAAAAEESGTQVTPSSADRSELAPYAALTGTLTLDDAVRLFRERGYDLLIADATITTAQGTLQSQGQFANPQITLGYGRSFGVPEAISNAFSAGINDSGVLLDTLLIGKRRLKVEVAQAALDATRLSRTDAERTLVATVKQAYVTAVATKRQLDVNKEILESIQQTEALVSTRYRLGAISEADLANQKTATFEAAQQVEIATQAYEQAKVALAFLLGVRGKTPVFDVDTGLFKAQPAATVQDATPDTLHDLARDHRPDVLAQRKQVARAEASITSARRQVVPDFALGATYLQQGGTNDPNLQPVTPPTLMFDLTVTPPLLYQQQGEITMAEADLRTQRVTLAKLDAQVLNDVDTGFSAFGAARRRLFRLNNGYLEQAQLARDLTKVQYEKGAASLVELLAAQRAYVTTVSEDIQALNDFWTAVFQLEEATGTEFKS